MLKDIFNRNINYLRISITDRCDLRCKYCMKERMQFLPKNEVLSFEEIERLVEIFLSQGIKKLRITGGEPLVRKGVDKLIQNIGKKLGTYNFEELTLTTNGTLLEKYAKSLKDSGLDYDFDLGVETLRVMTGTSGHCWQQRDGGAPFLSMLLEHAAGEPARLLLQVFPGQLAESVHGVAAEQG